ncbi:MAG: hypothetical protein J7J54_06870, partial [Candidatus Omnitrophica bacterium]|nr:hypothetical protein [Candidatus Omnitrophota bacterium]
MFKVCPQCNYIYDGKKWFQDDELLKKINRHNEAQKMLCTACKRIRDKIACGIVYLEADFLKQKEEEVKKFIRK